MDLHQEMKPDLQMVSHKVSYQQVKLMGGTWDWDWEAMQPTQVHMELDNRVKH